MLLRHTKARDLPLLLVSVFVIALAVANCNAVFEGHEYAVGVEGAFSKDKFSPFVEVSWGKSEVLRERVLV